ncbi:MULTISPECIES: hypothetical protein [unclassified Halobacteriovorax]|uniref:hypothetical protein n=1 Tax=unclassified Halobacteriovorax TaxID=2639665 RepID=UPI000EA2F2D1|nr:hypothetical protein [Halobacteriovorax sp. BALOs_7]AYF45191.1 hypothetical protein BALOs_2193 [Halobacteriovorax sp. BALOs_7]
MRFPKCLLLFFILFQTFALKIIWQPKREIGNTTIWKSTQTKSIRGSTQVLKSSKSFLANIDKRDKFVKSLEKKKRNGMKFLGISDWNAFEYKWQNDELTISGYYIDRKGLKNYFYERHTFLNDKRVISLITSLDKDKLNKEVISSFFQSTLKWESRK